MNKDEIILNIKEDVENELGEILEENEIGISYYDYDNGVESFYCFPEYCSLDRLKSKIFIGKSISEKGLTNEFVANMLQEVFKKDFVDAFCTLNSILIFSNEEELNAALEFAAPDEIEEVLSYDEHTIDSFEKHNVCGKMWYRKQSPMIYEKSILNVAIDIANKYANEKEDKEYYNQILNEEYSCGIIQTIIHECRHCMLETNLFLSEEKYPTYLNSENEVEEFCCSAYEMLSAKYKMLPYRV